MCYVHPLLTHLSGEIFVLGILELEETVKLSSKIKKLGFLPYLLTLILYFPRPFEGFIFHIWNFIRKVNHTMTQMKPHWSNYFEANFVRKVSRPLLLFKFDFLSWIHFCQGKNVFTFSCRNIGLKWLSLFGCLKCIVHVKLTKFWYKAEHYCGTVICSTENISG